MYWTSMYYIHFAPLMSPVRHSTGKRKGGLGRTGCNLTYALLYAFMSTNFSLAMLKNVVFFLVSPFLQFNQIVRKKEHTVRHRIYEYVLVHDDVIRNTAKSVARHQFCQIMNRTMHTPM